MNLEHVIIDLQQRVAQLEQTNRQLIAYVREVKTLCVETFEGHGKMLEHQSAHLRVLSDAVLRLLGGAEHAVPAMGGVTATRDDIRDESRFGASLSRSLHARGGDLEEVRRLTAELAALHRTADTADESNLPSLLSQAKAATNKLIRMHGD